MAAPAVHERQYRPATTAEPSSAEFTLMVEGGQFATKVDDRHAGLLFSPPIVVGGHRGVDRGADNF